MESFKGTNTRRVTVQASVFTICAYKCYALLMALKEQLDRADSARSSAWDAIEGPIAIVDARSHVLLSYASIALEHQEAIVLLARQRLSGSAFALVRPVFEILYRAAWICACAKPKEVDSIKAGKFTFPKMGDMVAAIDATHDFDFFKRFKACSWNEQNDFTHAGKLQIGSRLTRDDLQAEYPEEMIAAQVATTTSAAMMVAVLLLKTHNRISDGERLERALAQFSTA